MDQASLTALNIITRAVPYTSVNKAFLNKKLNVMLGFFDVLYKDYGPYSSTLTNQYFYWMDKGDTRRVRINISYRFGKMQIEQRIRTEGDARMRSAK